jgi:hypothetical protein
LFEKSFVEAPTEFRNPFRRHNRYRAAKPLHSPLLLATVPIRKMIRHKSAQGSQVFHSPPGSQHPYAGACLVERG